ncbi:MAG: OmpH family outer membrane protein [Planctomycetota bacterium]
MKQIALVLSAVVLAAALSTVASGQGDEPAPGAFPVLVCDFAHVIENCQEAKDIEEAFRKERKAAEDELKAKADELQKRIQDIQANQKLSERDDKVYEALRKAIEDKGRIDAQVAFRNVRDQDFLMRRMQELLRESRGYANDIMLARKAHVVLASKVGPIELEDNEAMQDELLRRRAICFVKGVNITDSVMEKMNEAYKKRKAQ